MLDGKGIKYDISSLQFVIGLQTISGLMAGFAFTGTVVVLTGLGDPTTFLSQLSLIILFSATLLFLLSLVELHFMNITICVHAPKPIIPICPARWNIINRYLIMGAFLVTSSIPVMFLLKNLILLFAISLCAAVFGNILFILYRWKPIRNEMKSVGII